MMYLDNGATSFWKPASVHEAVARTMRTCANPGRGGYPEAMMAAQVVYGCRSEAAKLFDCDPEQVVFIHNCTHGLNIALRALIKPGDRVVLSGFEHNAVTRTLHLLGAEQIVAGRRLFDQGNTLEEFEKELRKGATAAVFTHVSNVFGYIHPLEQMAMLCRSYGIPFVVDAAQSAGVLPVKLCRLGADFIAMPGHKGLMGPQGTGLLLCGRKPVPLLAGGTGSDSIRQEMPDYLPDIAEAGTLNVPGIAGLAAGIRYIREIGPEKIFRKEQALLNYTVRQMQDLNLKIFAGRHQAATVSFVPPMDCEKLAQQLAHRGIAVRAGLHCAPLAHESAGTLETGTVRISFGYHGSKSQVDQFIWHLKAILSRSS